MHFHAEISNSVQVRLNIFPGVELPWILLHNQGMCELPVEKYTSKYAFYSEDHP